VILLVSSLHLLSINIYFSEIFSVFYMPNWPWCLLIIDNANLAVEQLKCISSSYH
jgi:hypothetical protein